MKKMNRRAFLKTTGQLAMGVAAGNMASSLMLPRRAFATVPTIRFAYILSDHHAPLIVAAKHCEFFQQSFSIYLKPVIDGKRYDLYSEGERVADVQLIPTKKGPDVEKLVAQGSVDMAISGTQAVLLSIDRGVSTRIVSPLQTAGNVFVIDQKLPINSWNAFVAEVKGQERRFKIGIPGPETVASIIFSSALESEKITYTEDATDKKADVLFINMKGHGNLVAALGNQITQGIIGAQPFPAITIDRGIGRMILNLQDVPAAQDWHGHACCSLAATVPFLQQKPELAEMMLELMALGVEISNTRKDLTAQACATWLGDTISVERIAMESLSYTTTPSDQWRTSVNIFAQTMDDMGLFTGDLHGRQEANLATKAFDFNLIETVRQRLLAKKQIS
ncbi:MAG: ABC transporter substrate-binding protein [Pseudomonadota bacterium]